MTARAPFLLAFAFAASCSIEVVETNQKAAELVRNPRVDHSVFDGLLRRFVSDVGVVDYRAWHGDAEARAALQGYIRSLAAVDVAALADDAERMALWINAYNAVTVEGILGFWPTASIRDHRGFWTEIKTWVGDRQVSLDDIEHKILRPMGDPRIHVAVNCASQSCPILLDRAYTGTALDSLLDAQSRRFLADDVRNRFDGEARRAELSKIFSWFGEDFDPEPYGGVRGFVRRHGPEEHREWLSSEFSIGYLSYDWSLNGPSN